MSTSLLTPLPGASTLEPEARRDLNFLWVERTSKIQHSRAWSTDNWREIWTTLGNWNFDRTYREASIWHFRHWGTLPTSPVAVWSMPHAPHPTPKKLHLVQTCQCVSAIVVVETAHLKLKQHQTKSLSTFCVCVALWWQLATNRYCDHLAMNRFVCAVYGIATVCAVAGITLIWKFNVGILNIPVPQNLFRLDGQAEPNRAKRKRSKKKSAKNLTALSVEDLPSAEALTEKLQSSAHLLASGHLDHPNIQELHEWIVSIARLEEQKPFSFAISSQLVEVWPVRNVLFCVLYTTLFN